MTKVHRRDILLISLLALVVTTFMAAIIRHPGYTDAFLYYNIAARWMRGEGLTDAAPWSFIAAPHALPVPSNLYWMPGATFLAAPGIALFGQSFDAAQVFYVLMFIPLVVLGYLVGWQVSGTRRIAWLAALITLFSGFFWPYWVTTATYTPFGVAGAFSLFAAGMGRKYGGLRWFLLAGIAAGFGHLTRNDGFLLLLAIGPAAVWPGGLGGKWLIRKAVGAVVLIAMGYLIVMGPWFARNYAITAAILPGAGIETVFLREYAEIVNYPKGVDLQHFLSWGLGNILQSRLDGLASNGVRFFAEQGMLLFGPFMLYTYWRRRKDPFLAAFLLYAPGMFFTLTIIYTFPGTHGALFHSSAALVPFWATLSIMGVDSGVRWMATKRRWPFRQARAFFSTACIVFTVGLSLYAGFDKAGNWNTYGERYNKLSLLSKDSVVVINDPPALYYYKGIPGVVVPNAPPETLLDIANKYNITHIVLDEAVPEPLEELWERKRIPFFLKHEFYDGEFRVYSVRGKAEALGTD